MANVVCVKGCIDLLIELAWHMAIADDRLVVLLRSRDPHNLHLCVVVGQSDVNLFVACLYCDLYLGDFDQLLKSDFLVEVRIKELENRSDVIFGNLVFGLQNLKVGNHLTNVSKAILISIVCRLEKSFQVVKTHF